MNINVKNINNISHCWNRSKVQSKNHRKRVRIMVVNANFNNISIISWRTVLLVGKTGVPGENHRPVTSHWQTLSHNVVSSIPHLSGIRTHNVSGDICTDCVASCKSNYHTITTTNAPLERYKIDTPNTCVHDHLLSWLGTGTSIQSGWNKPILWAQFKPPSS